MKPQRLLVIILAGVSLFAGYTYLNREKAIAVTCKAVESGQVESTVANTRAGTVKAAQRARLAPAIGGQIATLPVKEGDKVVQGQILLTLWNKDITAQLQLARQEAVAAEVTADETCILSELALRTARRLTELKQKKTTSEASYDEAVTTARARQAGCEAARARHLALLTKVETVQAALDKTILRAPFSGIIAEVNGEAGEFVTPSPPGIPTLPAIDLINTEILFVSAPIDEIDAARIMPEMKARITLDAYPDKIFAGTVRRIAPYVLEQAKQARTVEVETMFADNMRPVNLLPGYSADVEIIAASRKKVLRVPSESLLAGDLVFVFNQVTSRLERHSVEIGLRNWRFSEVLSGLQAGELVVTSVDRQGLKDGVLVTVDDEAATGNEL